MVRRKAQPVEPKILEIDGVPTAEGLVAKGRQYAHRNPHGRIHITPEGKALITTALRAKAREAIEGNLWHGITGKHPGPPRQPGI